MAISAKTNGLQYTEAVSKVSAVSSMVTEEFGRLQQCTI